MKSGREGITAEDALEQFERLGEDLESFRSASLDFMGELLRVRQVRLAREGQRLALRLGADSSQAAAAAERLSGNDSLARAMWFERGRIATPVPPANPDKGVVFGRVLTAEGQPMGGVPVRAVAADGTVLAKGRSNRDGQYRLKVDPPGNGEIVVRAKNPATKKLEDVGSAKVLKGGRAPLEVILGVEASKRQPPPPKAPAPPRRAPSRAARVKVPNLSGMTAAEATVALASAGLRAAFPKDAPPGARVRSQRPSRGKEAAAGAEVVLALSAGGKKGGKGNKRRPKKG